MAVSKAYGLANHHTIRVFNAVWRGTWITIVSGSAHTGHTRVNRLFCIDYFGDTPIEISRG